MDGAIDIAGCIRPDGSLGGAGVLRRETLYLGRSGNRVERFWDSRRSYIYKPVGDPKTAGRERWVSRHLKPLIPGIRIPEIVAASDEAGQPAGRAWLVLEDLGAPRPIRTAAEAAEAAAWAAAWHRLPVSLVPDAFTGHTPLLDAVAEELKRDPAALERRLARAGMSEAGAWAVRLPGLQDLVTPCEAVCHGDYHPGNIAVHAAGPVVLDWEFVPRHPPYWDLYCLMDITSFRYRKIRLTNRSRLKVLGRYLEALSDKSADKPASGSADRLNAADRILRERSAAQPPAGPVSPDGGGRQGVLLRFARGYAAYAVVYSAWILGLIENDLASGRAPRRQLERQWRETAGVLHDCLSLLVETGA